MVDAVLSHVESIRLRRLGAMRALTRVLTFDHCTDRAYRFYVTAAPMPSYERSEEKLLSA
jgi:hypothetical protein